MRLQGIYARLFLNSAAPERPALQIGEISLMSYSLLSLITATPMAKASPTPEEEVEDEDEEPTPSAGKKGAINSHGAWCWRESCEGEFRLQFVGLFVDAQQNVCD